MNEQVPSVVVVGLVLLVAVVVALFVVAAWASAPGPERARQAVRAALGVDLLLAWGAVAALTGVLSDASRRPPAFPIVMAIAVAATVLTARSSLGSRISQLPLWALVGAQGFRFPLELVMHRAASAGVMPPEMTFGGLNYDIVTGVSALLLGFLLYRGALPRALLVAWNVMGSLLLAVIVGVAFAATPIVKAFGPEHVNTWVMYFPYVWLPTVLVQAALFGHIVIFRRLLAERAGRVDNGGVGRAPSRA